MISNTKCQIVAILLFFSLMERIFSSVEASTIHFISFWLLAPVCVLYWNALQSSSDWSIMNCNFITIPLIKWCYSWANNWCCVWSVTLVFRSFRSLWAHRRSSWLRIFNQHLDLFQIIIVWLSLLQFFHQNKWFLFYYLAFIGSSFD